MSSRSKSYVLRITFWHPGFRSCISIRRPLLISPSFDRNRRRFHATVAAQLLDKGPNDYTPDQDARMKSVWGPVPYRWKPSTKNIVVGDLPATLKAHREANKDRIVRRIRSDRGGLDTRRLALRTAGTRGAELRLDGYVEESARYAGPVSILCQNSELVDSSSLVPSEVSSSTSESTSASVLLDIPKDKELPIKTEDRAPYRDVQGIWSSWGRKDSQTIQRPWINHVLVEETDPVLRLDEEIRAFERYMMPTVEEDASVQQIVTHVKNVVASVAPSNEISIHGSRYTGLASPFSDIDFAVSLPEEENSHSKHGSRPTHPVIQKAGRKLLRKIMYALQRSQLYENIEYVNARVDLVTATDLSTGIVSQISALAPYMPAREYTMMYLKEYAALRPLYTLLRHSLVIRDLATVYKGGIGSYPLLIMIVTALKHADTLFSSDDLGKQLLHVLRFWSDADIYNNGYSADPPRVFPKISSKTEIRMSLDKRADPYLRGIEYIGKQNTDKPWLLCLQDPGNPTNDLGKKATEIRYIQGIFSAAYDHILEAIRKWNILTVRDAKMAGFYTFLNKLARANYTDFENQRAKLRNHGQSHSMVHRMPTQPIESSTTIIRRYESIYKPSANQIAIPKAGLHSNRIVISKYDPYRNQEMILKPSKVPDVAESKN